MPFFLGAISGVLITVLAVFLVDALTATIEPAGVQSQRIVNWDVASARLEASTETIREGVQELREGVRSLTR
jgi:hypothetical protein